jgi:hypothetical protein
MIETHATLRVMGLRVDPSAVSLRLGLQPTQAHRAGDPNVGPSGRRYSDFREGLWALDSPLPSSSSLTDHLQALVDLVLTRETAIGNLKQLGYRVDFYLSAFDLEDSGGFFFPAALLQAMGRLGIDLNLDLYYNVADESCHPLGEVPRGNRRREVGPTLGLAGPSKAKRVQERDRVSPPKRKKPTPKRRR